MTSYQEYAPIHYEDDMHVVDIYSLTNLAKKLATEGPHRIEPAQRRVRGMLDGKFVFDTTDAKFVWEHPNYPW
jgi:hypothetical protein